MICGYFAGFWVLCESSKIAKKKLNVVNNVWVFKYQLHYKTCIFPVYFVSKVYAKMNVFIAANTVTFSE